MQGFILSQLAFYLSILLVLFLPGYTFLLAIFGKKHLSIFERVVIAPGLGILVCDFLMLIMAKIGLPFGRISIASMIMLFSLICWSVYFFIKRKDTPATDSINSSIRFSKKQALFFLVALTLSIFLRGTYLMNAIPASTTDLGHHMYWSKLFSETGTIQNYTSKDIVETNEHFVIADPKPISDFIIGEHLIFSAINLVSGLDYTSFFPIFLLFFIDILTLLTIFILSLKLFQLHPDKNNIAITALLFSGILFAIDPPQAKFVGGGLVGNLIGNLIIPLTFYFYIRFLQEKETVFLFFALFFSMGLFYTHHLSGLIFIFIFAIFFISSLVFNFKEVKLLAMETKKVLSSPLIFGFAIFAIMMLYVYIPSYLTNKAVTTVVGTVTKVEHAGLELSKFKDIVGEARLALGFLSILFIISHLKKSEGKTRYSYLLLLAWIGILTLISLAPNFVGLDIPAGRIANYATYPLAILSAYFFTVIFSSNGLISETSNKLVGLSFVLIVLYLFLDGQGNFTGFLKEGDDPKAANSTYQASQYLAEKMDRADYLIDDHVNLSADSWVKLFFMRDYNFPLYRANLDRYENGIDKKEFCTLWMISNPESKDAEKCFQDLSVDFVMVDQGTDSPQFKKLANYWQVYSNDNVNIYYRKN